MPSVRETVFAESFSADPVERALAGRAARILAHPLLDGRERVALVRQVQQELLAHRRQRTKALSAESPREKPQRGRHKAAVAPGPMAARRQEAALH